MEAPIILTEGCAEPFPIPDDLADGLPPIGDQVKPLELARQFMACASAMISLRIGGDPDDMREKLDKAMVVAAHSLHAMLTEVSAPDIETAELIGALEGWLP